MIFKIIRFLSLCIFYMFCSQVSAQQVSTQQEDYLAEIGLTGGGSYYLGDANNQLFANALSTYGGFFRYRFNPRIALKAELNNTEIAGKYKNENDQTLDFQNQVAAVDVCGEFNFFDLEQNPYKRFSKTFSPYIFAGVGIMNYLYISSKKLTYSLPFGVGLKLKLANRWNLNAQWSNRLLFSDQLEGIAALNNAYKLNGSNFTNNDLLSTLTIGVSFDFWKRPCKCKSGSSIKNRYKNNKTH